MARQSIDKQQDTCYFGGLLSFQNKDFCLIEHVWAMLKEIKELGQKSNLQLIKVNSLDLKGNGQENVEKSH